MQNKCANFCSIFCRLHNGSLIRLLQGALLVCTLVMPAMRNVVKYLLDNDECVEQSPCDDSAVCINNPGSFTCACNEGYSGDGMTCTGQSFITGLASYDFEC